MPDLLRIDGTTLTEAAQAMLRQVVWANALFRQHQRQAWIDVGRAFPGTGGEWLGEAALAIADLVVQDMTVSFALEEERPRILSRAARFVRWVFGLERSPPARVFRFARPGARAPIQVRLHVRHTPEGRFTVQSEVYPPQAAPLLG